MIDTTNNISVNCSITDVNANYSEFTVAVTASLYNISDDDISAVYQDGDNENNYKLGVLLNYVGFRVLRREGDYDYDPVDELQWEDVTCATFVNGAVQNNPTMDGKVVNGDVALAHLPKTDASDNMQYGLLLANYNVSGQAYSDWWDAAGLTPAVGFRCAMNFGRYFSDGVWGDSGFSGDTYNKFQDAAYLAAHDNYDAQLVLENNRVEINYHFPESDYTYYVEFSYPTLDDNNNYVWTTEASYVRPYSEVIEWHSEYVDDSCRIISQQNPCPFGANFATTSVLDKYMLNVARQLSFQNQNLTIEFKLKKVMNNGYVIVSSAGDNGSISPLGNTPAGRGSNKQFDMTPSAGYEIASVTIDGIDRTVEVVGRTYIFENITANHTIHVEFATVPTQYHIIEVRCGEGGTITPNGEGTEGYVTVPHGASQSFVVQSNANTWINDIRIDDASIGLDDSLHLQEYLYTFENVTENHVILANFFKIMIYVAVRPEPAAYGDAEIHVNGTVVPRWEQYYYGDTAVVVATPNSGYEFHSWRENNRILSTELRYEFTVYRPKELVAYFKEPQPPLHTITATAGANGSIYQSGAITVSDNGSCAFTFTPDEGYQIESVLVDGVAVEPYSPYVFNNVVTDHTIIVSFVLDETCVLTLLSDPVEAASQLTGTGNYTSGDTVSIEAVPVPQYGFIGWYLNNEPFAEEPDYSFVIDDDVTLVARFEQYDLCHITVGANPSDGGIVTGGSYPVGYNMTVVATPYAGYVFSSWLEDGYVVSTDASYSFNVSRDRNLVAVFMPTSGVTYNITVIADPHNGGMVTGAGTHPENTTATLTAIPEAQYEFARWRENGAIVSTNAVYTFTVTGDRTLTAEFELRTYTLTLTTIPNNGGTVTGAGTYTAYEIANVTATPNAGYGFDGWYLDTERQSTSLNYSCAMLADTELAAKFFFIGTCNVATASNPSAGGTTSGGGSYNAGDNVTVVATPNAGYNFLYWTNGVDIVSYNSTYSFQCTESLTLVAHFEVVAQQYQISVSANPSGVATPTPIGGAVVAHGTTVTVDVTNIDTNYGFVSWTENGVVVSTSQQYSFVATENRNLVANLGILREITVNAIPPASSTITVNGAIVSGSTWEPEGATVEITCTPNGSNVFDNWGCNGVAMTSGATINTVVGVANAYTAYCHDASSYGTVTVGTVGQIGLCEVILNEKSFATEGDPYSCPITIGVVAPINILANPHYAIESVLVDGTGVQVTDRYNMTYNLVCSGNNRLEAKCGPERYNVIANASQHGTATGGNWVMYGNSITVTATPDTGYVFTEWRDENDNVVSTSATYTFYPDMDITLTAYFEPAPPPLVS